MKADELADRAGRWGGHLPTTGLCFRFFLGPQNRNMHLQSSYFGWVQIVLS